jgi:16S rRNA (adenine1518-N6/adenine1519-N6)-dimethyltransferase
MLLVDMIFQNREYMSKINQKHSHDQKPIQLKALSQVFLIDSTPLNCVIDFLKSRSIDTVVEIGPGTGILTDLLCEAGLNITCVEKDPRFTLYCENKYKDKTNIKIINDDILLFDLLGWKSKSKGSRFSVVGNIPYSISSKILEKILRHFEHLDSFVLMAQKEFFQKILLEPSALGTLLSILATSTVLNQVPRTSFDPQPKVDSTIVSGVFETSDLDPSFKDNFDSFLNFLRQIFLHKKKKLKNSLAPFILEFSSPIPETFLDKRPHELNPNDLWLIFKLIKGI